MHEFHYVELDPDERIVFGVTTITKSTNANINVAGITIAGDQAHESRRVAITDRRVIVETEGNRAATRTLPNSQVQRVVLTPTKFLDEPRLRLVRLEDATGQTLPLDWEVAGSHAQLRELFPNAELEETKRRGLLAWLGLR